MRPIIAIFAAFLATNSQVAHAENVAISPLALVGTWTASDTKPNLGVFITNVTLTQSMKFSGSVSRDGKSVWNYSGTWELDGTRLTWHYENSSRPLSDLAKNDIDDIALVDGKQLVLVSRLSGLQHVFSRAK